MVKLQHPIVEIVDHDLKYKSRITCKSFTIVSMQEAGFGFFLALGLANAHQMKDFKLQYIIIGKISSHIFFIL